MDKTGNKEILSETIDIEITIELEQNILAVLLTGPAVVPLVLSRLKVEDFVNPFNALIYKAIKKLHGSKDNIDPVSVTAKAKQLDPETWTRFDGPNSLLSLASNLGQVSNVETYVKQLRDISLKRQLEFNLDKTKNEVQKDKLTGREYADKILSLSLGLLKEYENKTDISMKKAVQIATDFIKKNSETPEKLYMPSGIKALDDLLGGLGGYLYVIGGRTSQGKSFLLSNMAYNLAKQGLPVLFFSLEMDPLNIIQRLLGLHLRRNYIDDIHDFPMSLACGNILYDSDREYVKRSLDEIKKLPITMVRDTRINDLGVVAKADLFKEINEQPPVVIIDYIQKMHSAQHYDRRDRELTTMMETFLDLAYDNERPVIVASQLNRGVEKRVNKQPQAADAKDSGGIEETADVFITIRRPYFYDKTISPNLLNLYVSKNRHGEIGELEVNFNPGQGIIE